MCNYEEDFCGVAKYKHQYTLMDKIILGVIFLCLFTAIVLIGISIRNLLSCY